jgi:6-pyruvoyltetrahydropterin/6-carboxytetrahydropterin synthase
MLIDFYDLKKYLSEVLKPLDHRLLNELPEFKEKNPTAENIARVIYENFEKKLPEGVALLEVSVQETARNKATYKK